MSCSFFGFLKRRSADVEGVPAPAGQPVRLTPNQQKTLDAIRRYEAKLVPRLRNVKRPPDREPDTARLTEVKAHILQAWRDTHRVQARLRIALPPTFIQEVRKHEPSQVELKAEGRRGFVLTLFGADPRNPNERVTLGKYEVDAIRATSPTAMRARGRRVVLVEARDKRLVLILPSSAISPRLRSKRGVNQGEVHQWLHQARERMRRQKKEKI